MLFPWGRCQFFGIVEEKNLRFGISPKVVEVPREGKEHMESQESCPLKQTELLLCSSELTGDAGCVWPSPR